MIKKPIGFSLIEVLISLLILSFILLGFDAMEITSIQENHAAYLSNIAIHQLQNMSERLYALNNSPGLSEQVMEWNEENKKVLPHGRGEVAGNYPDYLLTIFWGETTTCEKNQIGRSGCLKIKFQR